MQLALFDIRRGAEVILTIHSGRRSTKPHHHLIKRGLPPYSDVLWSLLQPSGHQSPNYRPSDSVQYTMEGMSVAEERRLFRYPWPF